MMQKDIKRLSLILLFAPFALWIALLIILPHLGMFYHVTAEKVGAACLRVRLRELPQFLQRTDLLEHAFAHRVDVPSGDRVWRCCWASRSPITSPRSPGNRARGACS
jgi:hypothetical protein